MTKILISSTSFGQKNKTPLELLQSTGYEITWNETGKSLSVADLITALEDCTGVIAGLDNFSAEVLHADCKVQQHRHSRAGGNRDERYEHCFLAPRLRGGDGNGDFAILEGSLFTELTR